MGTRIYIYILAGLAVCSGGWIGYNELTKRGDGELPHISKVANTVSTVEQVASQVSGSSGSTGGDG